MLPIVANIVANNHKKSAKHGFMLSFAYGIGVSTAYGVLGVVVAIFGRQYIIQAMQSPIVLLVSAVIFIVLGFYMLGLITIRLPFFVTQKLQQISDKGQGSMGGVFGSAVAGFFSAIVVSPCVTAPLVGALIGVASVGDPLFGFVALFMLGMGLSVPLIVVGTTESSILPKSGSWMDWVKQGFALLLFAVAILLLDRVFESPWELLLWAMLAIAFAVWFWSFKGKAKMVTRFFALVAIIWAGLLAVGATLGNYSPLKPLNTPKIVLETTDMAAQNNVSEPVKSHKPLVKAYTVAELNTVIQENPYVVVDVWATWCIECKIMDAEIFADKPKEMLDWQLVKLDITEVNEDSKAVMEHLDLFGPPALAFYKNGELIGIKHGETKREEFITMVSTIQNTQ